MDDITKTNIKVLVTGATGFIGSHLVKRLVSEGWQTHIIIRKASNLYLIKNVIDKIIIHEHDGSTENMMEILKEVKPELVFHLASLFLARHRPDDIEALIKSNILFPTQLLEAMAANDTGYLINTGTSWQHYNNDEYNPVCLYAATKQAYEAIIKFYVESCNLKVLTLKLFDTYGPDDPRDKIFSLLKKSIIDGRELSMSPGEQLIDLVYIDDVIDAYILAAEMLLNNQGNNYQEYAVSSKKPIKLKDLAGLFEKAAMKKLPISWGGRQYRLREVMFPWSKGELLPGWEPKVSLEKGIKRLIGTEQHLPG